MANHTDRLSNIPVTILGNIFSRLPLQSTVATCVLSRNWIRFWPKFITHLIFDYNVFLKFTNSQFPASFAGFMAFINDVVNQLTTSHVHTFKISIESDPCPCPEIEFRMPLLWAWLHRICSLNPKVIDICTKYWADRSLISFPIGAFDCKSIEELRLSGNFWLSGDEGIDIPKLKTLDISLTAFNSGYLSKLVKLVNSCKDLETLKLFLNLRIRDLAIRLCAPNLLDCDIVLWGSYRGGNFEIDAPEVISLKLGGGLAYYSFVNQPLNLEKAVISFRPNASENPNMLSGLIRGISSINYLQLIFSLAICNCLNNMSDLTRPKFDNLTSLSIVRVADDIIFEGADIPECLLRNLKYAEVMGTEGHEAEIKLVKKILRCANGLEELLVYAVSMDAYEVGNREKDQLWMEFKYCRELFENPINPLCKIRFEGFYIEASSKDEIEKGVFTSTLNCYARKLPEI